MARKKRKSGGKRTHVKAYSVKAHTRKHRRKGK